MTATANMRQWMDDGSRVAAVVGATTSTFRSLLPREWTRALVPNIDAGLARCKPGHGDTVLVLPDYAEDISGADHLSSLVAGTRIMGLGHGKLKPTLTWTASASTILLDQANSELCNFTLNFASAANSGVAVTLGVGMAADGCGLADCDIFFAADANDVVTRGIEVEDAADCYLMNCHAIGETAGEVVSFMDLHNADRFKMHDTIIEGATSNAAVGMVRFVSEASFNIDLQRNTYINRKASSSVVVTGLAGVSGVSRDEMFCSLSDSGLGIWGTSTGAMFFFNPRVANAAGESGGVPTGSAA